MDKIFIVDLPIKCIVGVYPEEREFEQELIFNITLLLDLSVSCFSDNVKDTIDSEIIVSKIPTNLVLSILNLFALNSLSTNSIIRV